MGPGHRWGQGCSCVNAKEHEERCGCSSGAEEHRLGHGCGCVNAKGTIYKPRSKMCGAAAGHGGPDWPGCSCRQQGGGHAGVRLLATGGQGKQGRKQAGVQLLATGGASRQGCGSWPWRAPRRQGQAGGVWLLAMGSASRQVCGSWPREVQAGRGATAGHEGRKTAGVQLLATGGHTPARGAAAGATRESGEGREVTRRRVVLAE